MSTESVGSLEEEALKRKERLNNLKRKKSNIQERLDSESTQASNSERTQLPMPTFRSYKPWDESLKELVLPTAQLGDVELQVKDQLAAGKERVVIEELDITNLAPRKPDWDLKRDVKKKLEKLDRRTQKAIAELIRDRLKKGQNQN